MRLGVLDIGSNTGHLLVVDAHGGAAPLPASSHKQPLRLAEHLDDDGAVTKKGIKALTDFCKSATEIAEDKGCEEMLGFATSAVRDAVNSHDVLEHVEKHSGVTLEVLSGEDEARLTFLAVRRWFGWSAGRLAVFDIGGGSLEIAGGTDENPDVAWSLPLGAARMARDVVRRGAAVRGRHPRPAQADPCRDRPRRRAPAAPRRPRPGRRDVEDVPLARPHLRCRARAATGRSCRGSSSSRPCRSGSRS